MLIDAKVAAFKKKRFIKGIPMVREAVLRIYFQLEFSNKSKYWRAYII